jgi:hypothetical protein
MLPLSLARKLGLHPMILAHLGDISSSFSKIGTSRLGPMYGKEGTSLSETVTLYYP